MYPLALFSRGADGSLHLQVEQEDKLILIRRNSYIQVDYDHPCPRDISSGFGFLMPDMCLLTDTHKLYI